MIISNNFSQTLFRGGKWLQCEIQTRYHIQTSYSCVSHYIVGCVIRYESKKKKKNTNKKRLFFFAVSFRPLVRFSFMFFALFPFIPNEYTYFRCRQQAFGSFHFLLIMCAHCAQYIQLHYFIQYIGSVALNWKS